MINTFLMFTEMFAMMKMITSVEPTYNGHNGHMFISF